MLRQRIITSLILLIVTGVVLFTFSEFGFETVSLVICLMAIHEITVMYKFDKINQFCFSGIFVLIALCLYYTRYDMSALIKMIAICTWCLIVPLILVRRPQYFSKIIISGLAIIVFIPTFYALIVLYALLGSWQVLSLMAVAWVADIGAYFVGGKYGRHKLAPLISPSKSIEGALAALGCSIVYLLILKKFNLVVYLPDYTTVFRFALILVSAAIAGDLFESWLKRVAKVKDSGSILPGHGGIFDRIDSLVAVLAIGFVLIRGI